MWQQKKMAFKDTLSSEENFPLSLVQNYYFSNFPSEVLGGTVYIKLCFWRLCFKAVKYANILRPFSSFFLYDWALLLLRITAIL